MINLTKSLEKNGLSLLATGSALVGENVDWPLERTLYSYLVEWAQITSHHVTVIDIHGEEITYEMLLNRVNNRAYLLEKKHAFGRVVISEHSRGIECLVDILACSAVGAIYTPIDPQWPEARRKHIKTITNAAAIFTENTSHVTEAKAPLGVTFLERVDDPFNTPSYCFFTSGSTGEPKGALIAHMGMMNHLHSKAHLLHLGADSVVAQTAPTTFDVSIWQFCSALLVGGAVRIVPNGISQDPHELFSLLKEKHITHIELVPTVFRELIHEIGPSVSFSGLEYVLVTGEELPLRLAKDWAEKFPSVPLINAYGPTECSDDVTHAIVDGESLNSGEVPIGIPIPNASLYVLEYAEGTWRPVPPGAQGELFVAGLCVGLGYIGSPDKTAQAFARIDGYPFRIYRTGDLVHQRADSQLVYDGRADRQIKISGVRIEPGEIENRILQEIPELEDVVVVKFHPRVRERRAMVLRETTHQFLRQGDASLAAFYLPRADCLITPKMLNNRAKSSLPRVMCPSRWIEVTDIPTTSNGKVDIKLLERRAGELLLNEIQESREGSIPGRVEQNQDSFILLVQDVLGTPVNPELTFIESGGDSLRAIQLANIVRSRGSYVRVRDLLSSYTLGSLAKEYQAQQISPKKSTSAKRSPSRFDDVKIPLTCDMNPAQQGIYFQWLLEPESPYYNYQILLECAGSNTDRIRRALGQALRANPQLMAKFGVDSTGRFTQTFPISAIDMDEISIHEVASAQEARKICWMKAAVPFNLEEGPAIAVDEIRINGYSTWFVLTMNEILIDGWGAMKFMEQLISLFECRNMDDQKIEVKTAMTSALEYFQHLSKPEEISAEAREFWSKSLDGVKSCFPLRDTLNSSCDPYAASVIEVSLDDEATAEIRSTAHALSTSPFAVFVAAYSLALAAVSDQHDFVVGAPVAGRNDEYEIGVPTLMLNMIAIRTRIDVEKKISDTVRSMISNVTEAVSFGDSVFSKVVSEFADHTNEDPLFSTMVNMLTYPSLEFWDGDRSLHLTELNTGFTKYDASLYIQRHGENYTLQLAYKVAYVTPERANKVLALTAWFLTSDWLSGKTTVANAIKTALNDCDTSQITMLKSY